MLCVLEIRMGGGLGYVLQTTTGQWAWCTTKSLTEPIMVRRTFPSPRVPITIIVACSSSATRTMISPGFAPPPSDRTRPDIWNQSCILIKEQQRCAITSKSGWKSTIWGAKILISLHTSQRKIGTPTIHQDYHWLGHTQYILQSTDPDGHIFASSEDKK